MSGRRIAAMRHRRNPWVRLCGVGLLLAVLVISHRAGAGTVSFSARIQDDLRVADTEVSEHQGVAYISLPALVRQLGGGCSVALERVQVDLTGRTAWLKLNNVEVRASLGQFGLTHPLLEQGNDARMALSDVTPFFEKAFRLGLKQDTAAPAPPLAAPPAPPEAPAPPREEPAPAAPVTRVAAPLATAVARPIQVIIIDPGHGGKDAGFEGQEGFKESALTLAVAQRLSRALGEGGTLKIQQTRNKDMDLSRAERVGFAAANRGDLLLCLHGATSLSATARGFEVFAADRSSVTGDEYAKASRGIAEAVAIKLGESTGAQSRGIHSMPCLPSSGAAMASLIVEMGFLTNPAEQALLQTEEYQEKIAQGLAAGIQEYAKARESGGTSR